MTLRGRVTAEYPDADDLSAELARMAEAAIHRLAGAMGTFIEVFFEASGALGGPRFGGWAFVTG